VRAIMDAIMQTRIVKTLLFSAAVFGLSLAIGSASALAADKDLIKGEAIVVPAPGVSIETILAAYRATLVDEFDRPDGTTVYLVRLRSTKKTPKQIRKMQADARILSAATNSKMRTPSRHSPLSFPFDVPVLAEPDPFDPTGYDQQPFLTNLKLPEALAMSRGAGVVVAVVDTGIDATGHPDLAARLWVNPREQENGVDDDDSDNLGIVDDVRGWDFLDGDNDPSDEGTFGDPASPVYGHGTFIAGIITKIAPEARIMPIRVFGPDGEGTAWNIARAIEYAVTHGATVVNLSFGTDEDLDPIHDVVGDVKDRAVLVAAAGNAATRTQFPARRSEVIAVAAVTDQDQRANFTNLGSDIDVSAPGVRLQSMFPGGRYAIWSGTSFAAPIVSATAALRIARVLADVPDVRHKDLIDDTVDAIEDNTTPVSGDGLGRGRVDPTKVIRAELPDGDNSGHGGGGDDDNSGHGGGGDDDKW
jgi:subtilisin family serine protease